MPSLQRSGNHKPLGQRFGIVRGTDRPFPTGVETHIVAVFDHTDTSAGANGTMTLYRDGAFIDAGLIHADVLLNFLNDNNN